MIVNTRNEFCFTLYFRNIILDDIFGGFFLDFYLYKYNKKLILQLFLQGFIHTNIVVKCAFGL